MSLIDVHSAATAGIVGALIAAEAMRASILLVIKTPQTGSLRRFCVSACESCRIRLWLRKRQRS